VKPLLPLAVLLLAAPAALARPAPLGRDAPLPSSGGQPHPAVARIVVPEGSTTSLGSGTLVAVSGKLGLVVTNWHVVRDATGQIVVVFPDGFRSAATVVRTDPDWDLAALAVWRPGAEPVPLATEPPQPGQPLTIAGYGSGRYRAITGRCTQYVAPGRNQPFEMVELAAGAREGDSGGPIFNNRGELAGVLFGTARGQTAGSYCGRVRQFLAAAADDFRRVEAGSTMIAQRPQVEARATGIRRPSEATMGARQAQPSAGGDADREHGSGRLPLVSIPVRQSPSPSAASPQDGWTASAPPPDAAGQTADPPAAEPLRWQDIAGTTLGEQLKTVLAAVGALAIFAQVLRLLATPEPTRREARSAQGARASKA
jgi:S1-C subfamily serine protease